MSTSSIYPSYQSFVLPSSFISAIEPRGHFDGEVQRVRYHLVVNTDSPRVQHAVNGMPALVNQNVDRRLGTEEDVARSPVVRIPRHALGKRTVPRRCVQLGVLERQGEVISLYEMNRIIVNGEMQHLGTIVKLDALFLHENLRFSKLSRLELFVKFILSEPLDGLNQP